MGGNVSEDEMAVVDTSFISEISLHLSMPCS
jgi:hypothetical protein